MVSQAPSAPSLSLMQKRNSIRRTPIKPTFLSEIPNFFPSFLYTFHKLIQGTAVAWPGGAVRDGDYAVVYIYANEYIILLCSSAG